MNFINLIEIAHNIAKPRKLSEFAECGTVGACILTESGKVFSGVCIDTACGTGFCAEHSAGSAMISAGENRVIKIVAVGSDGTIMPPCGRCREFISQLHKDNILAEVLVKSDKIVLLKDLLPYDWKS